MQEETSCRGFGGVPQNPPESPFVKGGLRGIGIKGAERGLLDALFCHGARAFAGEQEI